MKVLHGFTGSVATTLVKKFHTAYTDNHEHQPQYVLTKAATEFALGYADDIVDWHHNNIWDDAAEWEHFREKNRVLHIELTKWADAFVLAPCSANTLAKLANGICDNLVTCCARAWDFSKPFIVAPAMNTKMWEHPITQEHITKIKSWGIEVVDPQAKTLYCKDVGMGAMANVSDILGFLPAKKRKCGACNGTGEQWMGDPSYGTEYVSSCVVCNGEKYV